MIKKLSLWSICILISAQLSAQKLITLDNIWKDYTFYPTYVSGFNFQNDGRHYTRLEQDNIQQYDLTTGVNTQAILKGSDLKGKDGFNGHISNYALSEDESKVIFSSESEAIYRHSTRAKFFVYDFVTQSLTTVFPKGKIRYATLNPQGNKVAFVFKNDLYIKDLINGDVTQVTKDGKHNSIINGATDWVYEEEFSFSVGFQWAPDGEKVAFYRFDESAVREFTYTNYNDDLYPEYVTFKYPKVGEKNAIVTIHIYDVKSEMTTRVNTFVNEDHYIPRIKWTNDPNQLCVFRMNRHQNKLELLLADAKTGKTSLLLKEENKYYIDIHDNLTFLKDGKHFIWTSEMSGWNHIYLYDMNGKMKYQITNGQWEVTDVYGVNEKKGLVYYQAAEESPMERQIYAASINGKKAQDIFTQKGWASAQFSSTFDYLVVTHSTINSPTTYSVYDNKGKLVRVIEDNARQVANQKTYGTNPVEFFSFSTENDVKLNGWMIKPSFFDPDKKYPVLMYLYGGPGSQEVLDKWKNQNYWWFQMLAQKGFIVACVDNRGTGGRGEEFKKMTYLQLGRYETEDQIEAAKYLGDLDYVDESRIGIFGWSYGGYMSSLCLLKGNDVFKAAIAIAPVTNWKWYDSVYTERYMRTERENPEGFHQNSPVYFADRLKGNYLIVHGMSDDNVHLQNSAEMVKELIKNNKQFDTYFYPNKNHSIYGGLTRLHLYTKMTNFLIEKLKNTGKNAKRVKNQGSLRVISGKQKKMKSNKKMKKY